MKTFSGPQISRARLMKLWKWSLLVFGGRTKGSPGVLLEFPLAFLLGVFNALPPSTIGTACFAVGLEDIAVSFLFLGACYVDFGQKKDFAL